MDVSSWRRFWLANYYVGVLKYFVYQCARMVWGYSAWHCLPINWRPYAVHIIETMESMIKTGEIRDGYIVEVGCGKGDIIGNIRYGRKLGLDIEAEVLDAAKYLHSDTEFQQGEIKDISVDSIDALIIVNWLHGEEPEKLHELLIPHLKHTKIFVLDVWLDANGNRLEGNRFSQDGNYLCDGKFVLYEKTESEKTNTEGKSCLKHVEYWVRNSAC